MFVKMNEQSMVYLRSGLLFSFKKNEVPLHVTTWTDLENTMLSERSQA